MRANYYLLLTISFLCIQFSGRGQTKYVLAEEGTGTWCQWCTGGIAEMRELKKNYPNLIAVEVHGNDPMENVDYDAASAFQGFPTGHFDRASLSVSVPSWEATLQTRLALVPPADVDVTYAFDASTRDLDVTVEGTFFDSLNGDYRFAAIVIENGITGPSPSYDQSNSYSGGANGPAGGFEDMPNPVPAAMMVYNNVGRELLGGYDGEQGSLPSVIASGEVHDHTFSIALSEDYNEEYVRVVGIIIDANTGVVVNAGKSDYLNGTTNGKPFFHSEGLTEGFVGTTYQYDIVTHDPDYDDLTISGATVPSWLSLTDEGTGFGILTGSPTSEGSYDVLLELTDGTYTIEQSFTIEVTEAIEDWELVGSTDFYAAEAHYTHIETDGEGTPYVLASSFDSDDLGVYQFDGDDWVLLDSKMDTDSPNHTSLAVTDEGVVYITDGNGDVLMYADDEWTDIGNYSTGTYSVDLVPDGDGGLFMAVSNEEEVYHYDGSDWSSLGNYHDDITAALSLVVDENDQPMLLYGADYVNIPYSEVSVYDGTDWSVKGGDYVYPDNRTYFYHDIAVSSDGDITVALVSGFSDQKLKIVQFNNGSWEVLTEDLIGGGADDCKVEYDANGNLIVTYVDLSSSGKLSTQMYDGTSWKHMGIKGFTGVAGSLDLTLGKYDWPYVVYYDESNSSEITVKRYVDLTFDPTGLEQASLEAGSGLVVFPNPGSNVITISTRSTGDLHIVDVTGKRVYSERNIGQGQVAIDVSQLPAGFYTAMLQGDNELRTAAFSIVR